MNHNSSPALDYPPSSSMSEGDSLSDSDWLDISSNRESDDNDSVMSGDSEREDVLMPLSRRSSMSVGSSRDGDVEAWEGFVEDSGDEDVSINQRAATASDPTAVAIEPSSAAELTTGVGHDLVEEQRVKEALDQSLISTLSASRSSAGSTHTSLRDLRLSFPDPLTSSRDELNGSCEDLSPSETMFTATDVPTDNATDADNVTVEFSDIPLCKQDPGSFDTTPEVAEQEVSVYPEDSKFGFDVVLYGSSSPIKWSFVQTLVQKAVLVNGITVTDMMTGTEELTRYLHLQQKSDGTSPSITHLLPIHDRTESVNAADALVSQALIKRPSLAILYLPSAIQALPDHTLYLPVFVPSGSPAADDLSQTIAANDWNTLSIPPNKVVRLGLGIGSPIFDSRDVGEVQDLRAHRLLQRLLSEARKRPVKFLSDHLSPVHAVTLFALMSLIVGFAMNTAFRRSSVPTPTTTSATPPASTFWGLFGPEVNTSAFATTARVNVPAVTTHKDFSLSIFNPGSTSLSITSNKRPPVASTSSPAQVEASYSNPPTGTDVARSAEDTVSLETKLPTDTKTPMTIIPSAFKFDGLSESKSTALSLVVDSLSEVLDVRVARLRSDLDELVESLDELGRAISRQTKQRVDLSKGKAKEIRERVQYRHHRARGKAKQLKKKGEEMFYSAGEQLIGRTKIAKQRARDIGNNLAKSEVGRAYRKAHAEWVAMLKEKGGEGGQTNRRNERMNCQERGKSTGATNFFSWSYAELYFA